VFEVGWREYLNGGSEYGSQFNIRRLIYSPKEDKHTAKNLICSETIKANLLDQQ
jgi:hypothetical protein